MEGSSGQRALEEEVRWYQRLLVLLLQVKITVRCPAATIFHVLQSCDTSHARTSLKLGSPVLCVVVGRVMAFLFSGIPIHRQVPHFRVLQTSSLEILEGGPYDRENRACMRLSAED